MLNFEHYPKLLVAGEFNRYAEVNKMKNLSIALLFTTTAIPIISTALVNIPQVAVQAQISHSSISEINKLLGQARREQANGNHRQALIVAEKALRIARSAKSIGLEGSVLMTMAESYEALRQPELANPLREKGAELLIKWMAREKIADELNKSAVSDFFARAYGKALQKFEKLIRDHADDLSSDLIAGAMMHSGYIYLEHYKQPQKALSYYLEVEKYYPSFQTATYLEQIGRCYESLNQPLKALQYYQRLKQPSASVSASQDRLQEKLGLKLNGKIGLDNIAEMARLASTQEKLGFKTEALESYNQIIFLLKRSRTQPQLLQWAEQGVARLSTTR
jgi:tetratricopeptide (TPR) repeat protein